MKLVTLPRAVLVNADCVDAMAVMAENSVDAIVTDPPYGLRFMGKGWDDQGAGPQQRAWHARWVTQALRVLKPGGHMLAFGGSRTVQHLAVAAEDCGFEVREMLLWAYGAGFPKSRDVGKALDKMDKNEIVDARARTFTAWMRSTGITAAQINTATDSFMGSHYLTDKSQPAVATEDLFSKLRPLLPTVPAEIEELVRSRTVESENMKRRAVVGYSNAGIASGTGKHAGQADAYGFGAAFAITAPATNLARQWHGWGTALKPAIEPIVLARKPFSGSVAANVQTWGVGALNIDGCRVPMPENAKNPSIARYTSTQQQGNNGWEHINRGARFDESAAASAALGRWPANFLHDGSPEVIDLLPGGAASFFYSAKAQTGEREYGTSTLPERTLARSGGAQLAEARGEDYEEGQGIGLNRVQIRRNIHPTVKPVELLAYLQRLVTPPGGLVLDPFAGSGSAGIAAAFEGFQYVGIELDTQEGYFGIAAARIVQAQADAAAGLTWKQALKKDKAARGPRVDAPEDAG